MISVNIAINERVIYARTAVNLGDETRTSHPNRYKLDDGSVIPHIPKDGMVKLAKRMLDSIHEVGVKK